MKVDLEGSYRSESRPRGRARSAKAVLGAVAVAGMLFSGGAPAHAAGAFNRTLHPLGCITPYEVMGGSYATSGGAAAYTSRTEVTCVVIPWQDVGARVQRGSAYGPYKKGSNYAQSTVSGSGAVKGYHLYQNEANQVYT